jgi:aerotaxis receptor
MKSTSITLSDQPREFAADEIFFSTTDRRGVIESGNDVFMRIAGYTSEELIGKAHNIVRHPDMPQAAFRLVWDTLKAGKTVAAMVKNLAKDGRYYWVVALIAPTPKGYLSVRFKPTGSFLAVIEPLYAAMVAAEKTARDSGAELKETMEAGARVLAEGLRAHKFENYEAFMRALLCDELKSRDETLAREQRSIIRPADGKSAGETDVVGRHLAAIYGNGRQAYARLDQLYHRLDEFVALNDTLNKKSAFVNSLTDELGLASMNVALASSRLGGEGQGLSVISRHMGETSSDVGKVVHGLVAGINALSDRLRVVIFNLAAARLQIEMMLTFVHELIGAESDPAKRRERRTLIHTLHEAFGVSMSQASAALHELESNAHVLGATSRDLERHMLSLQVAQLSGVVESTRLVMSDGFGDIFAHIRQQIERTHHELSDLGDALQKLDTLACETPVIAREIESAADRMEADIGLLVAA